MCRFSAAFSPFATSSDPPRLAINSSNSNPVLITRAVTTCIPYATRHTLALSFSLVTLSRYINRRLTGWGTSLITDISNGRAGFQELVDERGFVGAGERHISQLYALTVYTLSYWCLQMNGDAAGQVQERMREEEDKVNSIQGVRSGRDGPTRRALMQEGE